MSDNKNSAAKRKGGLGRGLGSLLEGNKYTGKTESSTLNEVNTIADIAIDQIQTNPYQPRTHFDQTALEELAESIKIQGIIQPITVRQLGPNSYQLISGERRYQASKIAGLTVIPAFIRKADDQQMLEMALIENIQRENLNAIEIALSYQRLLTECSLKQEELGDRVGKKRTTVTNYLRLLKLPPDIQIALRDNVISMGHARALINIDTIEQQLDVFKEVVAKELSVRKVEELVRNLQNAKKKPDPQHKLQFNKYEEELKTVQTKLSSQFGTKIQVKANDEGKGEIKIPFVSVDELNRILEILNY
ncbi:ParB family chromosome partitioning protein [Pontibacter ummariensis]|uniref:Chromosome partitioning protein, ParB family n=1 Tax=Pontibacter ummariensis TaxID=1610492 RepID=A0A239FCF6_9BACT|nr:ParB/RepB/Spo0J family partition protein [Pontibacter ummariensis]PRY12352.1 ParB family chromosome partitioning protein [Pontibacter ummariensis]SNS53764.1 chromosome partitioning protein, ParB family [Pontibacter ummariensis]